MATSSGRKHRRTAFFIGLLITVLAGGAYQLGWLDWLEAKSYDACFHMLPASQRVPDCGQIVHVDIDDNSLGQFGRWPWPRAYLAGVVDVLSELDSRAIVLDIIMPEPQQPRPRIEPYSKNYDLVGREWFLNFDPDDVVRDDRMLADAVGGTLVNGATSRPRTFLSMHFEPGEPIVAPTTLPNRTLDSLRSDTGRAWMKAQVWAMLRDKQSSTSQPEHFSAGTRSSPEASAGDRIGHCSALTVAEAIYPAAAREAGPIQDVIFACYRQTLAMQMINARWSLGRQERSSGRVLSAANAVPPIPDLARAARGVGFVCFEPDSDGAMRAIPLLMSYDGQLYPQLALVVACDAAGVPLASVRIEGRDPQRWLVLPEAKLPGGRSSDLCIPVDGRGRMLINWRFPSANWQDSFRHLPISAVMNIVRNRELIREKLDQRRDAPVRAVLLAFGGERSTQAVSYAAARELVANAGSLPEDVRRLRLEEARTVMAEIEREARDWLTVLLTQQRAMAAADSSPESRETLAILEALDNAFVNPERLDAEIAGLRQLDRDRLAELRPIVAGKICFVGSTATGAADFVNTPVFARCPGVVVHSNILNTMLTGRFIRPTPRWMNLLAIILCGLLATVLTAGFGPRLSGMLVLATMVGVTGANVLVVFGRMSYWVVLAGPLLAIFASSGGVMLYRWWTEARQRRWVTQLLGSYTSPAVARRISEQNNLLALSGEQRVITCMFTDLKGFTPLSERLGTEQTVKLLNRYFDRMSEVLLHHDATISKFLGDGIFAFFGAPDVMLDHPRRAAAAALDLREELRLFCRELADENSPQLAMRVGLATGHAMFGNCGSSKKFDYTALGPTVNLASRLEGANKFFGTGIMIAGETAAECDRDFVIRPLGQVRLVGVQQPVRVSELVARLADSRESDRTWAARFGGAVDLHAAREFARAADEFDALWRVRPNDRATQIYSDLCQAALRDPPGNDWSPVIVLTEK